MRLGHLVLYVRDLEASLDFYQRAIGLQQSGRLFDGRAVMLTGGETHHELMLIEVVDAPAPGPGKRLGLYHFAFSLGEDGQLLAEAKQRLDDLGVAIQGMADHTITRSLYLADPDGNLLELYVDNPNLDWRKDKSWLTAPVKPLQL